MPRISSNPTRVYYPLPNSFPHHYLIRSQSVIPSSSSSSSSSIIPTTTSLPTPASIHRSASDHPPPFLHRPPSSSSSSSSSPTLKPLDIQWKSSFELLRDYFPHTCIPSDLSVLALFELEIDPTSDPLAYQIQQQLIASYKTSCQFCQYLGD